MNTSTPAGPFTDKQKMLAGQLYDAQDSELTRERVHAHGLTRILNDTLENEQAKRHALLTQLLGSVGSGIFVEPPFYCDYGYNIHVGDNFYANFDCLILDAGEVRIGNGCLLAPGVHIYTSTHPVRAAERATGLESALPVRIGDNVWIGGRAVILPGVSIGDNVIVAAGAIVTTDVPDNVMVAGNPAAIRKELEGINRNPD